MLTHLLQEVEVLVDVPWGLGIHNIYGGCANALSMNESTVVVLAGYFLTRVTPVEGLY